MINWEINRKNQSNFLLNSKHKAHTFNENLLQAYFFNIFICLVFGIFNGTDH